jgi:hypothetical protein
MRQLFIDPAREWPDIAALQDRCTRCNASCERAGDREFFYMQMDDAQAQLFCAKCLPGQRCLSPAGRGEILAVRYCDILLRWRASILLDTLQEDGTRYAACDITELMLDPTRLCSGCHELPASDGNFCQNCAEIYDFAQAEVKRQRRIERKESWM